MTTSPSRVDIRSEADVITLVNSFCHKLSNDDLLAPLYNAVAQIHWPYHLTSMYGFWNGVVFGKTTGSGQPLPPHLALPLVGPHFQRCLSLFQTTIGEHFAGEKAEKVRAQSMLLTAA